jgi:hypothetical protein
MIHGAHIIVYSKDAGADRAFFRLPGRGKVGAYQPKHPLAHELAKGTDA